MTYSILLLSIFKIFKTLIFLSITITINRFYTHRQTYRFSGSQLNGSALTNSLLMTEPLKEPDTPALRPKHKHRLNELHDAPRILTFP